jgi:hypothetical protein
MSKHNTQVQTRNRDVRARYCIPNDPEHGDVMTRHCISNGCHRRDSNRDSIAADVSCQTMYNMDSCSVASFDMGPWNTHSCRLSLLRTRACTGNCELVL